MATWIGTNQNYNSPSNWTGGNVPAATNHVEAWLLSNT